MAIRCGFGVRLLPLAVAACLVVIAACAPEVGSARWCEAMKAKPSGDWTANEALEYARSCVLN